MSSNRRAKVRILADYHWNDLRDFLAVARSGRLTAAAARRRIDHATLSRRIAGLEQALGAKLFDRSPTGYTLTDHGRRLVPMAEEVERAATVAGEAVGGSADAIDGVVRIGSPEGFGSYFLAPRIARLNAAHPRLRIQLVAASAVFSLSRRDADLVVSVSRPPAGRLKASRLLDYDLALYAAPAYLGAHPPIAATDDLAGHAFVSYIGDLLNFAELDFQQQVAPDGVVALESSNLVAQLKATIGGAGLCILPAFLARDEPGLVRVLPDAVKLTRSLWLIVHQDLAELARVRATIDFIRAEVAAARPEFALA